MEIESCFYELKYLYYTYSVGSYSHLTQYHTLFMSIKVEYIIF